MAENENVLDEAPVTGGTPEIPEKPEAPLNSEPSKGSKFKAGAKEWLRKKTVALKRKPQNIALFFLAVTSIYFMLALYSVSQAINRVFSEATVTATGICIFIVTLLSLLVLVSFLNAFPKRKKQNIFFTALVFVMIAGMIACDIVYYVQMGNCLTAHPDPASVLYQTVNAAQPYILAHVVLLGISAVIFALLPVYRKLINKINTKVELESATENMRGAIDIEE